MSASFDRRVIRIEDEAKEYAEKVGDKAARWPYQSGAFRAELRKECDTVAQFTGANAKPQSGCFFQKLWAGDAEFIVECEYTPGEPANMDADSPTCGPGEAAQIALIQVLINGQWIDPEDIFDQVVIDRWTQQVFDSQLEKERDSYEDDSRERMAA